MEVPENGFIVLSDRFLENVPPGMCLIKGVVRDTEKADTVAGGKVVADDHEVTVDSNGCYRIMVEAGLGNLLYVGDGFRTISVSREFKSQHEVIMDFYGECDPPAWLNSDVERKPVIYLYAEAIDDIKVQLDVIGRMTFSYPEYSDGWNVSVNQDEITDKRSQKKYPYLFWEGEQKGMSFMRNGTTVPGSAVLRNDVVSFLENQLTALGLNDREKTDFITFWAPLMIAHPSVFVQFLVDDEYSEKIATLKITPNPDAIRRIYMLYKPLYPNVSLNYSARQSLNTLIRFERKGFTVVEWGGTELSVSSLTP